MRRKIMVITIVILICIFSVISSIVIHELGHVLMSIICLQVLPNEIHLGVETYVSIPVYGASEVDLAMISIGSIILPELIYLILLIFKNVYVDIIRITSASMHYMNIILSIWVLIFGSKQAETYDIIQFQKYLGLDSNIIIVGLMFLLLSNIILEWKNKGFNRIVDKFS